MKNLSLWWAGLAAREQRWVAAAAALLGAALIWWLAMAPALKTLRAAPAQHAALDSQLQTMRAQAAQAKEFRAQRALSFDESQRALESSVKQTLGTGANVAINDSRANLSLKNVSADALAVWLNQARINARVVPSEVRLTRSAAPAVAASGATLGTAPGALPGASNPQHWDGTIALTLPPRN